MVNAHLVRAGLRKRYRFEELAPDNGERFFNDKIARATRASTTAPAAAAAAAAAAAPVFAPPAKKRATTAWDKKMRACSGAPVCYAHYIGRTAVRRKGPGRRTHDPRCKFFPK